jgi:hypothetical protein
MKQGNTKSLSKEEEEDLFHSDIYCNSCECVKKTIIRMIIFFYVAFTLGLNCAELIQDAEQKKEARR